MKKILLVVLLLFIEIGFAATFNSVVTGNWSASATWGNAGSPPVVGTDFPGQGDVVNINSGDTVTYDTACGGTGFSTVTILSGGYLWVDTSKSETFAVGAANFTIRSGGTFEIFKSLKLPKARKFLLTINTATDNTIGFRVGIGGICRIYGDSSYYTVDTTTLKNSAENTDNDSIVTCNRADMTIWNVGDRIGILRMRDANYSLGDQLTIVRGFTIVRINEDTLFLSSPLRNVETGIGNTYQGLVFNYTRNITIMKYGADTLFGDSSAHVGTNRPVFIDSNNVAGNFVMKNVRIVQMYQVYLQGKNAKFESCVVSNGTFGLNGGTWANTGVNFNGHVVFNTTGISGFYFSKFSGWVGCSGGAFSGSNATVLVRCNMSELNNFGTQNGYYGCTNDTIGGRMFCNYLNFVQSFAPKVPQFGFSRVVNALIYANAYDNQGASVSFVNCVFGRNPLGSLDTGSYNIHEPYSSNQPIFVQCSTYNGGGRLKIANRTTQGNYLWTALIGHQGVVGNDGIIQSFGDAWRTACDGAGDAPSVDPNGGNGYCIAIENLQSGLDTNNYVDAWCTDKVAVWATAGVSKTYTWKVQTTMTSLGAGLRLIAYYLNSATLVTYGEVRSTSTVAIRTDDTDWAKTVAVTVNPSQTGFIYFALRLNYYEANDEVYVWPTPTIE